MWVEGSRGSGGLGHQVVEIAPARRGAEPGAPTEARVAAEAAFWDLARAEHELQFPEKLAAEVGADPLGDLPVRRPLQRSIPSLQPKGASLYTIPGLPPDLSQLIAGCAFAARCEHASDLCRAGTPALTEAEAGHAHACVRVQAGEI